MNDSRSLFDRFRPRAVMPRSILVVGLGRFGGAMADTLMELGHEVLGVDRDPDRVARFADRLTHTAEVDTSDIEALRQLGAADMAHAVVAIGTYLEASVLTVAALVDLGVEDIWAKAITVEHKSILERVGAHHVVLPEVDMGRRVAHLITGDAIDYVKIDDDFVLVETRTPAVYAGRTLGDAGIRDRFDVTVVCVKPPGGSFTYATTATVLEPDGLLLVAGSAAAADAFARSA